MLGDSVEVVLDGGPCPGAAASTIVDCTGVRPRILREGVLGASEIAAVLEGLGTGLAPEGEPDPPETHPDTDQGAAPDHA
jgi:hypothetical protein